jgi:MFS family permease
LIGALSFAVVAFGFQQTGVVPAIPAIQSSLHASQTWSAWLQTGYLVASCILTPLAGKLGDRSGKRRLLVAALVMFLIGSIGAAASPSLAWLIAFRTLQGGGGAVFPLALSIARDELPRDKVPATIGVLTGMFGLGTALGFVGGAALVQVVGWRWVFVVGGAAVAMAIPTVLLGVPATPGRSHERLDWIGGALFTAGLSIILVTLTEGTSLGWISAPVIGGVIVGLALLAAWVAFDLHVDNPLLDLRVLAQRTVLLTNLATIGLGFMLFGTYFLVPFLVQGSGAGGYGLGANTLQSGLYLLPAALGELVTGPLAPRLAARLPAKWIYAAGLALAAMGDAGLAAAHRHGAEIVACTLLVGAGAGLAIGIASDVVAEAVDDEQTGIATSINSVLRRVGGGIGAQVAAALLAGLVVAGHPSDGAFQAAFWSAAGVGVVATALVAGIRPN